VKTANLSEQLPSTWTTRNFKYLATVQKGRIAQEPTSTPSSEDDVPYLSMEYLRGETSIPSYVSLDSQPLLADDGDVLLLWDGSNAGEFMLSKRGAVSSTGARVIPSGVDRNYFYWACKAAEPVLKAETVGMGIPHVDGIFLGSLKIPLPPVSEQLIIAEFLSNETAKLDNLIEAKKCLIDLIAEKRRALITHALTRGLNPDAPLRDSGIPWLGKILKHWVTERAKWLFSERDERSESGEEEMLTVSHLTGVTPRSEKDVTMFEAESTEGYKLCFAGDLVINTLWAWMGAMGVSKVNGIVSPAYNVYTPSNRFEPAYVDAVVRIKIFAQEATRYSKGVWSSRLRLYPESFFEICLPVPPIDEQREIVGYIEKETTKLDTLRVAAERTIGLLKERRGALIAEAVTGKIKALLPIAENS
jgi:type I restriction enzyme S subunit